MRNIFDQYSQPENRVTHALMTALNEDRRLLGYFLRELVKVKPPVAPQKLTMLEQQFPGEEEPSETEFERRGIPDGWIFDNEGWCVLIETKVMAPLRAAQILSHRRTAERRGFRNITAVAITPLLDTTLPSGTVLLEWRMIYTWLRQYSASSCWARRTTEFLEIAEAKLVETEQFVEGTLTTFAGFPFGPDRPYTYLEGKRVLALARDALSHRRDLRQRLRMNPNVPGRTAITGRQGEAVWNFLSLSNAADAKSFTKYPHLTIGVTASSVEAMVTIPNSVNSVMRRNLKLLDQDGFQVLAGEIVNNLKPLLRKHGGATPWFRGIQRRYRTQRSTPYIDARIDFDLRTALPTSGPPKTQPVWLSAAYGAFLKKGGSNYQIQIGVIFRYARCPELKRSDAIELIARAWLACKPLVDLAR